ETARRGVKVIRVLSYFLLFLVLALFAAAVYLAEGRRLRLLMGCGVSLLIVGLIVLVVRRYAGTYLVDALTNNPENKGPVNKVWAIETNLLRNVGINAVVYGIGIMFAAWIAGASPAIAEVDAVLLSHVHWDHLDQRSLDLVSPRRLVVPRGAGRLLERFEGVMELDEGESLTIGPLTVRGTHAEHHARRLPFGP